MVPLTGPIDDPGAQSVMAMMLFLFDQDKNNPINLLIDSEGGLASSGLAIIDVIRENAPMTYTVVPRYAAGIATIILACGAKGHRRIGKNAVIHISPVTSLHETSRTSPEITRIRNELTEILASCTGQQLNSIRKDLYWGREFNAESALAYGLADDILRS